MCSQPPSSNYKKKYNKWQKISPKAMYNFAKRNEFRAHKSILKRKEQKKKENTSCMMEKSESLLSRVLVGEASTQIHEKDEKNAKWQNTHQKVQKKNNPLTLPSFRQK